ncbi:MAG: SBBP repeat-containing protein [Sedimentisphaerales bacterium]
MKSYMVIICVVLFFPALSLAETPPLQQWVSTYNGTGNFDDYAYVITTDSSGNVYVSGRCQGIISYDIVTVKYDSAGNLLWSVSYDGPNHSMDTPKAIAVDNSGNVYVAGQRYPNGSSTAYYTTIKYDPNGNQLWVSYYGGHSSSDTANAIAVDNSGNVYVTGTYYESVSLDIATIKYDSNGNQLWVAPYYVSTYGGNDIARALVLDSSNNVYIAGSGGSGNTDYVTVKYNTNGQKLWSAQYNGTGTGTDYANAIAVDSSGNVYVGGQSTGSGTGYDYTTVKYNSSGIQQWAARYDGPSSSTDIIYKLVLDSSNNVYVTGESNGVGSARDYATIKYNSAGSQLWVSRYNGTANGTDVAIDMAVDGSGNTYVTGRSIGNDYDYATIKYDTNGNQLWVSRYNGPANYTDYAYALTIRGSYIYVTGYSCDPNTYKDYLTIKYDLNGNQQWLARFNGHAYFDDVAYAMAVDKFANVYVTGTAAGDTNSFDCVTVKYDSSGNQLWKRAYDAAHYTDTGRDIAVDNSGNVYVAAQKYNNINTASSDYAVIKYDSNGVQLWTAIYNGPANDQDAPYALAVDNSGNVYVTGYSYSSSTNSDYLTIKYDPNGNQLWQARYDNPDHSSDQARAIAVDDAGNTYITGATRGDYGTIKYDSNGVQLWIATYNGPDGVVDEATALAIDSAGNVYVTGDSRTSSGSIDYATIKYNSSGSQLWAARYNGPSNGFDQAYDIGIDNSGNVYVTGYSSGADTNDDFATVKYSSDGNQLWVARYNGPTNGNDYAVKLAIDRYNNVYITGLSDQNYVTLKYDANGNQLWLITYNGPGNSHDYPCDLKIDGFGNVYVLGTSDSARGDSDYATIKYTQHGYCFEPIDGDYNGNCKVEFTDFAVLANAWLAGYDLFDLDTLADNWLNCNFALEEDCW